MERQISPPSQPIYPLDPLYINQRRVAGLVGAEYLASELSRIRGSSEKQTLSLQEIRCAELFRNWLEASSVDVSSLHAAYLSDRLKAGTLFCHEGTITFRNVRGRRRSPAPLGHTILDGLAVDGGNVTLELKLSPDHVVTGSPGDLLSKQVTDLFVVAQTLAADERNVSAVPLFIGYHRKQGFFEPIQRRDRNELFVDSIDTFSRVADVVPPSETELGLLRNVTEQEVKTAFAEIIGEPDIPKDWGGERSDLYTTYLRVDGERISTAFAFKGPAGGSRFHEMRISDLGKRGDQIERLWTEPADLLIVQHCHKIGTDVRSTIRAFCNQVGREKRYCLIPGYDTLRVLRAYGKCGF